MTSHDISVELDKITSDLDSKRTLTIPNIPTSGTLQVTKTILDKFLSAFEKNYADKNLVTVALFNYLQNLLDRGVEVIGRSSLSINTFIRSKKSAFAASVTKTLAKCEQLNKRPDLLKIVREPLLSNLQKCLEQMDAEKIQQLVENKPIKSEQMRTAVLSALKAKNLPTAKMIKTKEGDWLLSVSEAETTESEKKPKKIVVVEPGKVTVIGEPKKESVSLVPRTELVPATEHPLGEQEVFVQTESGTVIESNANVQKLLDEIKVHLNKIDTKNFKIKTEGENTLRLDNVTLSVKCILHHFGNDPNFLKDEANNAECTKALKEYSTIINEKPKFDLKKLINTKTIKPENYAKDLAFYENLYNFIISMAKFISAKENNFSAATPVTQSNILTGIKDFIFNTIQYQITFMEKNKVINDSYIKNSYNLLYLLNVIASRHANTGRTLENLTDIYKSLQDQILTNINLYKTIDTNKLVTAIKTGEIEKKFVNEIDTLVTDLQKRLIILRNQHNTLKKNVSEINESSVALEVLADEKTKILASYIRSPRGEEPR